MFRSFLSWRYLVSRRSNWVGVGGILVGVGALILIVSIMTGFLEEQRRALRGTLSDVVIRPYQGATLAPIRQPKTPDPFFELVAADPDVRGTAAQLQWAAMINRPGTDYSRLLATSQAADLLFVRLAGIDVHSDLRTTWPLVQSAAGLLGGLVPNLPIHDELEASDFLHSLVGPPGTEGPWTFAPPVPLLPFLPPAEADGLSRSTCLVGEKLADRLDIRPGDTIQLATLVFEDNGGEPTYNTRDFIVTGTFRTEENETDLERVYVARRELADFLASELPYNQIVVRVDDFERHGHLVRDRLERTLGEARLIRGPDFASGEVLTWEDFHRSLLRAIENERMLIALMLSLVLLVAGFTIFATLSMMVTEKRRDIGILTALGATPRGILQVFLMIAFWDALIGAALGGVLGTWLAIKIDPIERWLSAVFGVQIFDRDVYLFSHIPTIVDPVAVALIVGSAFLLAHLFAAVPAWRAARLDALEALRYE